jgi:hypothetical protein
MYISNLDNKNPKKPKTPKYQQKEPSSARKTLNRVVVKEKEKGKCRHLLVQEDSRALS